MEVGLEFLFEVGLKTGPLLVPVFEFEGDVLSLVEQREDVNDVGVLGLGGDEADFVLPLSALGADQKQVQTGLEGLDRLEEELVLERAVKRRDGVYNGPNLK